MMRGDSGCAANSTTPGRSSRDLVDVIAVAKDPLDRPREQFLFCETLFARIDQLAVALRRPSGDEDRIDVGGPGMEDHRGHGIVDRREADVVGPDQVTSACLPGLSDPMRCSIISARAPSMVAHWSAWRGEMVSRSSGAPRPAWAR